MILWPPTAIGTASLLERTRWWQRLPAYTHNDYLNVGVRYDAELPKFSLDTRGCEVIVALTSPYRLRISQFGPFDSHEIRATSYTGAARTDGGVLAPEKFEALKSPLADFLASHEEAEIRRWAQNPTTTSQNHVSILWGGRFLNGSIVLLCILPLLVGPLLLPGARRRRRMSRNLCPHCAYDLSATPGPLCPECGDPNPFAAR